MKMSHIKYILLVMVVGLLTACETAIEVDLPEYTPKLVIEGTIENGQPARVIISRSVSYFQELDFDYLNENVFIGDAEVTVTSSDGESERLTFQYCPDAALFFAYCSNHLIGKENTSYTLTVKYDGKTYTATTTIPHTFDLDSLWFDCPSDLINADTMRVIRTLLTDNANEANYYGFSVKLATPEYKDRLWISTLPLAFDDKTFNGLTFNYEIERFGTSAFIRGTIPEEQQYTYSRMTFRPGDTVYVKHSLMDYNTYRFMSTGGNEAISGTNPFTNPAPVISNIEGENVLGAWCGFASKIDKLVWETER